MNAWDHSLIKKGMPTQLANRRARIAAGERPLGWKVGLGAPAMMAKVGIAAPLVGFLMQGAQIASGGSVSLKGYVRPIAEAEIAVRMATSLGAGASPAAASAAIKDIMPAIEIADMDTLPAADNLDSVLEGGVFQRHVVIGDTARAGGSLAGITSRSFLNGKLVEATTNPEALTGKVVDTVVHVANTLAAYGETLSAGDIIIAGSITVPQLIEAGATDYVHALDPIGEVRLAFRYN